LTLFRRYRYNSLINLKKQASTMRRHLATLLAAMGIALGPVAVAAPEPGKSERTPAIDPAALSGGAGAASQSVAEAGEPPSDLWDRIRAGFAMPDLDSPLVLDREKWYSARPQQIRIMVERSRPYLFHIVEELERRGMPTELALLPMVESAFNPMAYSPAKASGLWQFIPSTGRSFRLDQNWWLDARRDIVASTSAALDYLQTIRDMHGDWHLGLASYNWGENAVARAVERNRRQGLPTDFNALQMPAETRWYVPKLLALKNIIRDPAGHGITLDPIPNAPYFATVQLNRDIDLDLAARLADMPLAELIALNPAHNRPMVASASETPLVIPAEKLERFLDNVANHDKPLTVWQVYAARRGEKLADLATRFRTTVAVLRNANSISGSGQLRNDAELLVPATEGVQLPDGLFKAAATISAEPEVVRLSAVAHAGDTWATLAGRLGVRPADMQRWNRNARVVPGRAYYAWHATGSDAATSAPAALQTSLATSAAGPATAGTSTAGNRPAAPRQPVPVPVQTRQIQRTGAARTVQATVTRPAPPPIPQTRAQATRPAAPAAAAPQPHGGTRPASGSPAASPATTARPLQGASAPVTCRQAAACPGATHRAAGTPARHAASASAQRG
jgi:membrane-bound lytic murein transglycosylase D